MSQEIYNIGMAVLGFLAVWVFKLIWTRMTAVEKLANQLELSMARDYYKKSEIDTVLTRMVDKVNRIESVEVLLASQYVNKTEFTRVIDQLFTKLDRIDEKLDNKADKTSRS